MMMTTASWFFYICYFNYLYLYQHDEQDYIKNIITQIQKNIVKLYKLYKLNKYLSF